MPPDRPLRVKFWGTRGSIPVAMTSAEVRRKLISALMRASGRRLETPEQAAAFLERELEFAVSHTFGGNSSCVEIATGQRDYVLCDLGSGARVFGNLLDPKSEIRWVLENKRVFVLKEELGTKPRFYYFFDK